MLESGLFTQQLWLDCDQTYASNPTGYISLQDNHKLNINLLLLAQYLDHHQHYITPIQWQQLTLSIAEWQNNILDPYRRLRRMAKAHMTDSEYQKLLEVELIMERKAQRLLLAKLNTMTFSAPYQQTNCQQLLQPCNLSLSSLAAFISSQ